MLQPSQAIPAAHAASWPLPHRRRTHQTRSSSRCRCRPHQNQSPSNLHHQIQPPMVPIQCSTVGLLSPRYIWPELVPQLLSPPNHGRCLWQMSRLEPVPPGGHFGHSCWTAQPNSAHVANRRAANIVFGAATISSGAANKQKHTMSRILYL